MAVTVTTTDATASHSAIRPVVSVAVAKIASAVSVHNTLASATFVQPFVSVTASVPASQIEYIELAAGAVLDDSGRFKFVGEIVLALDVLRIDTSKRLSDSFALIDKAALEARKAAFDSLAVADHISSINTAKQLAEATGVSDQVALAVGKVLADAFSLGDTKAITTSKALADTFGLTDAQQTSLQKSIADSVSLTDTFYLVLVFIRSAADSVAASDLASFVLAKAPFNESVVTSDESVRTLSKSITDGVAMNDGTSVGDGSTFYFEKNINNIAAVSDASSIQVQKSPTDSVATADSGLLVLQGYCDITYFSEDYVGTSTSF